MRLKQNELVTQRLTIGKTDSLAKEMQHFMFDGKVYPTGANIKKQEAEQKAFMEKNPGTAGVSNINPIK